MRDRRRTHPPTAEQRRRDLARSYAGVYKRRGLLVPEPCRECGAAEAQMHHPDYSRPLDVIWLCGPHHRALHRREKRELRERVAREGAATARARPAETR